MAEMDVEAEAEKVFQEYKKYTATEKARYKKRLDEVVNPKPLTVDATMGEIRIRLLEKINAEGVE